MKPKLRSVNTKFWQDIYIADLDPIEKLLFLYLLTNPLCNIAGVYEISLRQIAFDTGIDKDMIQKIFERFENDNKIVYEDNYIVLINFVKNQSYNDKMRIGAEEIINQLPENIKKIATQRNNSNLDRLSYDTIGYDNKKMNKKGNNEEEDEGKIPFSDFWKLYGKNNQTEKPDTKQIWDEYPADVQKEIMQYIPLYKISKPDKQYRHNPLNFLKKKIYLNEIIMKNGHISPFTTWEHLKTKNQSQLIEFDNETEKGKLKSLKTGEVFKISKYELQQNYNQIDK